MVDASPITIALSNFNSPEEQQIKTVFNYSELWLQPWRLIDALDSAQVILCRINDDKDLKAQNKIFSEGPEVCIIAYAETPSKNAGWHLKRHPNGRLSLLEFSQIMTQVCLALQSNIVSNADATTQKKVQPEQDSQSILPFIDKITTMLNTSGRGKKKRFTEN
jgi:hypothetical protein